VIDLEQIVTEIVRKVLREELATVTTQNAQPEYLTVSEYARRHSICERTVRDAVKDGRLPAERIGKRAVRVRADVAIGKPAETRPKAATIEEQALKLMRGGRR
jgi:excisionase family DNA binding protein